MNSFQSKFEFKLKRYKVDGKWYIMPDGIKVWMGAGLVERMKEQEGDINK